MASPGWEAVEALQERFNSQRGELFRNYPDRWVIWTDVGVVADFADERETYTVAFDRFEPGTFVVDQATEHELVLVTGFNALV